MHYTYNNMLTNINMKHESNGAKVIILAILTGAFAVTLFWMVK